MRIKYVLAVIGLLALGLFVWLAWEEIAEAVRLIRGFDWYILLLIIPIQLFNYLVRAWAYQSVLSYFGYYIRTGRLYAMAWVVNFVTLTMPSLGVSAASAVGMALQPYQVPAGAAVMVQYTKYGLTLISFLVVLLVGVVSLFLTGVGNDAVVQFVALVGVGIIGLMAVAVYLLSNQRAFNWAMYHVQAFIDWTSQKLRHGKKLIGAERVNKLLRELYRGFQDIVQQRAYLKRPFLFALCGNVIDVALLYLFFVAVGYMINPAIVIVTYALANSTGFVSIVPGDVGVYELVMIAVLTAAGVPLSVGLSVTLTYRVVVKFLFLPIGLFFYSRLVKEV